MNKNNTAIKPHAQYTAFEPEWRRARDVISGIKDGPEPYLPILGGQTKAEYAAYCTRACFFNATRRALTRYENLVFRKPPVITVGAAAALSPFLLDCDLRGTDFTAYARMVVREVLSVGRCATLVAPKDGRPTLTLFPAEDIMDWEVDSTSTPPRLSPSSAIRVPISRFLRRVES